jgi:hypothetical protein
MAESDFETVDETSEVKSSTIMVKILEIVIDLAYVLYDWATAQPPGIGTTLLVISACVAEVLLIAGESYTFYKYGRVNGPSTEQGFG